VEKRKNRLGRVYRMDNKPFSEAYLKAGTRAVGPKSIKAPSQFSLITAGSKIRKKSPAAKG
jgi:hypothetical protein